MDVNSTPSSTAGSVRTAKRRDLAVKALLYRKCSLCERELPTSEFYKDKRGVDGLTRRCRDCHSRKSYESRMKALGTPSARRDYSRKYYRQSKYGLTPEEYELMRAEQDDKCAICNEAEIDTWRGHVKDLAVDHDHNTGQVRGLLCAQCNTGIGKFKDNPELLKAAIAYLETGRTSDQRGIPLQSSQASSQGS